MKNNVIVKTITSLLICTILLSACTTSEKMSEKNIGDGVDGVEPSSVNELQTTDNFAPKIKYSTFDLNTEADQDIVYIRLNGESAEFESENVEIKDGILVISEAGDYELSGVFNKQICVNAGTNDNVHLIFNGVTLSADMAPLNIVSAKNVSITLVSGTVNSITDSENYSFEDDNEPNAAVYSKCDLTINGTGELTVYGMYNCGILSKDDLKIVNGNITVYSEGDAIKGKDSLVIRDGNITVKSKKDGLKSSNDKDENRGYVVIENGIIDITAADDGIHAESWLQIFDGDITINESYEAIEGKKIEIYGGNLDLTASDDGLNAASSGVSTDNDTFRKFGHEDKKLNSENIFNDFENREPPKIPSSEFMPAGEKPEDAEPPSMNNGVIAPDDHDKEHLNDMPDHLGNKNENFGRENGEMFGGNMGRGFNEAPEDGVYIKVFGGTIRVHAGVDVIDSNGTFEQVGGTIITVAPSMAICGQPDCVIDVNGDACVNGGTFISLVRNVGTASECMNVPAIFLDTYGADALEKLSIVDSLGNTVIEFVPKTSSPSIFLASDLLKAGEQYTLNYGEIVKKFIAADDLLTIE